MTDYIRNALDKTRAISADEITLWIFPRDDFAAWRAMPDTPPLKSYDEYLTVLAAIQADKEREGAVVRRVEFPVATMLAELTRHGWPNDCKHRAAVLGLVGG